MKHAFLPLAALSLSLLGCGARAPLSRFSAEFNCPQSSVEMTDLGAHTYRVRGCGNQVVYVCTGNLCVTDRDEGSRHRRAAVARRQRSRSRVRLGEARGSRALRYTLDAARDLELLYSPANDARHVYARVAPGRGEACEALSLEGERADVTFEAARSPSHPLRISLDSLDGLRPVRFRACDQLVPLAAADARALAEFVRRAEHMRGQTRVTRAAAPAEEPAAPTASEGEAALRAWLESHREVILACAQAELVVVRARAAEDGAVVLSLAPPHEGSAEGCVRSALGSPPPLEAGADIAHAVR
ncbi:MAG TPA: hypothetical protein DEF51_28645 [Myxococcales bacterium]|nr:hypothetical protein [Myxococcales bacterium]